MAYFKSRLNNTNILNETYLYKYVSMNPDRYEKKPLSELLESYKEYSILVAESYYTIDFRQELKSFDEWLLTEI